METKVIFYPPRRNGLIFHSTIILLLGGASLWGLHQATRTQVGPMFLLYLLPSLLALTLLPLAIYRAYALQRGNYMVERDGIRLRWGLRAEDIPMNEVLWVRSESEAGMKLPLPWSRIPGAWLGTNKLPSGAQIEYLAADRRHLLLIATKGRIYAISPAQPEEFQRAVQRLIELGSLNPIPYRSVYPAYLLRQIWAMLPARGLLITALLLSVILLIIVSLSVPNRETISMGFRPDGSPRDRVPSVQLVLLPLVNAFFFLGNALLGMFFFRRVIVNTQSNQESEFPTSLLREVKTSQVLAYTLWVTAALTPLFLLIAVYFILRVI